MPVACMGTEWVAAWADLVAECVAAWAVAWAAWVVVVVVVARGQLSEDACVEAACEATAWAAGLWLVVT